jgi:hypothetical protein
MRSPDRIPPGSSAPSSRRARGRSDVTALLAALAVAGAVSACGSSRSSAPSNTTPRATVAAFNLDLTRRDFSGACALVRPFARPLLTDLRAGHSLATCVAGLKAAAAPKLIAHYQLSAKQIRNAAVSKIGPNLDSLTPTPVPDPVYLLNRANDVWLIVGL